MQPPKLQAKTPTPPKLGGDPVEDFLAILQHGVNCWHTAGELLAEMRRKNPSIYAEIIRREPLLTVDMLTTIERIGRKELHPQLLLDSSMPLKRLIAYPYSEQVRLCKEPIDVVVRVNNGKPTVAKKMVRELSRLEMKRSLGMSAVRTVKEQTALWIPKHSEGNAAWRALSAPAAKVSSLPKVDSAPARMSISAPSNEAEKVNIPRPVPPDQLICIGRWVIRQTIGNNVGFERTSATGLNPLRVILEDGIAVIEVCKRK